MILKTEMYEVFMKKLILLLIIYICPIFAQKESFNWYFGDRGAITFDTPALVPKSLSDSKLSTLEGCASISSPEGKLLFYTDGISIWNKFHNVINPTEPMMGHYSSTQSAIIVKKPGVNSLYYIFSTDAAEYINPPNDGLHFTVVDVVANDSTMSVVELNTLLKKPMTEKITYTYHKNKTDFWIIAHESQTNSFFSYLLTKDGIVDTVQSSFGSVHDGQFIYSIGYMKVSPKQNMISLAVYADKLDTSFVEIFHFDNFTGEISDPVKINLYGKRPYGIEFSPNSKYLYVGETSTLITQYDVRELNYSKIINSKVTINTNIEVGQIGALQSAPDGKIYIVTKDRKILSAIRKPNLKCPDCNFNRDELTLTTGSCTSGLPQFIPPYPDYIVLNPCYGTSFSLFGDDILEDTLKYPFTLEWTSIKGFSSTQPKPFFSFADSTLTDTYKLTVTYNISGRDSVAVFYNIVNVKARPRFVIAGFDTICYGNSTKLSINPPVGSWKYQWSTGSTANNITVNSEGWYWLKVITEFGCTDSIAKYIKILPEAKSVIAGSNSFCTGDYTELKSEFEDNTYYYKWSTGDTTKSIKVSKGGKYWLEVYNQFGCMDSSTIEIYEFKSIYVKITGDTVICGNFESELIAEPNPFFPDADYTYLWNNNATTKSIKTNQTGRYIVKVSINNQCFGIDTVELNKFEIPTITLNIKDTVYACDGDKIYPEIIDFSQVFNYRWNTGSLNRNIEVTKTGRYVAYISNKGFCEDSAEVYIVFLPRPISEISSDGIASICKNQKITIYSKNKDKTYKYKWSDGSINDSLVITKGGLYTLIVSNGTCSDTSSITIDEIDYLPVNIDGKLSICDNEFAELTANIKNETPNLIFEYLWNTGETTKTIIVNNTGYYYVRVKQKDGCEGFDTVEVNKGKNHFPKLNKKFVQICQGDSVEIFDKDFNYLFLYKWNDGYDGYKRILKKSGVYILSVSDNGNCINYDTVTVETIEVPKAEFDVIGAYILCEGKSTTLKIRNYNPEYEYLWSNGSSDVEINIIQAGIYKLIAKNKLGCADSSFVEIFSASQMNPKLISQKDTLCGDEYTTISCDTKFQKYLWSNGTTAPTIKVNEAGVYSLTALDSNGCDYYAEIEIFKYILDTYIENSDIDFGKLCSYEQLNDIFSITNNSDYPIKYKIIRNSNTDFEIGNYQGFVEKKSYEEIKIFYTPEKFGLQSDSLEIEIIEPCQMSFKVYFKAEFLKSVELTATTHIAEEGDTVCASVFISDDCIINSSIHKNITLSLKLFYDVVLPLHTIPDNITFLTNRVVNGYRYITLKIDNFMITEKQQELLKLCFYTLTGGRDSTGLIIEKLEYDNHEITTNTTDGSIKLIGCSRDLKMLQSFTPTKISIADNINDGMRILLITEEQGEFDIEIYSSNGLLLSNYTLFKNNNETEEFDLKLDKDRFNNGLYLLKLKSPNVISSEKFIIIK